MIQPTHRFHRASRLSAGCHLLGRFFELRATIGLVNTLRLFLGHRLCREYQLHLPFLRGPICLRGRSADAHVFRKVFIAEEYFVAGLHPRLILDAGANIGLSAIYFATLYPEATILCVEPEDSNVVQFRKNTRAYPNIRLVQGALWSKSGLLAITNPQAAKVSFVVNEVSAAESHIVPGFGVKDLLASVGAERLDLLKVDIEGSEAQVFSGETDDWLSDVRAILIELHEDKAPGCGRVFFSASTRHPFQYRQRGENVVLTRAASEPEAPVGDEAWASPSEVWRRRYRTRDKDSVSPVS